MNLTGEKLDLQVALERCYVLSICSAVTEHTYKLTLSHTQRMQVLTLQFGLRVGSIDAPVMRDGTSRLEVVHDHVHPHLRALPGLQRLPNSHAPLQQGQDGDDVGDRCVGQGAALWKQRREFRAVSNDRRVGVS